MSNLEGHADMVRLDLPLYDIVHDCVGNPGNADFIAFFNGNQFMVLADLFAAFRLDSDKSQTLYYETLPPGILAKQITAHGRLDIGSLQLHVNPDVFAAGHHEMQQLASHLLSPVPYAQNHLALVMPKGASSTATLSDLGRLGVRVLMPNPMTEGIARLARRALEMDGGPQLAKTVFEEKVRRQETVFTTVHHRETIPAIAQGQFDVGVVWVSEAMYAASQGSPIVWTPFPSHANPVGRYYIAALKQAPHPNTAQHFLRFIASQTAQAIYHRYGFEAPNQDTPFDGF
ncbi:MAG: hypothetical protein C7B44_09240 [Sulfobacillus thermosulfidooxidans]|nr:MAG: hypothetical protein C7B44_09240 [Sulfobacillus thermosulfidooxidans]